MGADLAVQMISRVAPFAVRLKRYAEDQRSDLAYAFLIFRSDDNAMVGWTDAWPIFVVAWPRPAVSDIDRCAIRSQGLYDRRGTGTDTL
mgnify:CR=1 FL=1